MTPRHPTPEAPAHRDAEKRVIEIADLLRVDLLDVARSAAGGSLRPTRLGEELRIDRSLASRLVRGLRADSPLELIHHIPSPTGLRMFLDAAASAGVDEAVCDTARRTVDDYQSLLDSFPGGRSALNTLISESVIEVRDRSDRAAKQAVYKAMSHLLGFHCDTVTSALFLQPSEDGKWVDGLEVSQRTGIRRLRPSTPMAVFSVDLAPERPSGAGIRLEPIEGSPREPMSFLVPRFCDPSAPSLEIFREHTHTVFALTEDSASVDRPVTVTSAFFVRNGWLPYRAEDRLEEARGYLLHYPCKLLIRDLYIRDDLFVGALPQVRLEFPNPSGSTPHMGGLPERLNTLDLATPVEQLGIGLGNTQARGAPDHARLIRHVVERSGWEASRFRGYRTRLLYPVPMVSMIWWVPLMDAPR